MGTALPSDWKEGPEEAGGWQPPRCARPCPVQAARSVSCPGRRLGAGPRGGASGAGCGGAAPPGGHRGVCTRLSPGPGPRPRPARAQPDNPSPDPALVRALGTGSATSRADLDVLWPRGLGLRPSDTTMGGSATAGRGSPAGFLLPVTQPILEEGPGPPHLDLLTGWPVCKNTLTRPLGKWCNEQVAQNKGNKTPNSTHEVSSHTYFKSKTEQDR